MDPVASSCAASSPDCSSVLWGRGEGRTPSKAMRTRRSGEKQRGWKRQGGGGEGAEGGEGR